MKAKVAIIRCSTYDYPRVLVAIEQSLTLIGGLGAIVKPGQRVLLKVNLLSAKTPDQAITAHPAVVRALVELVRRAGAVPMIGDSPGGMDFDIQRVWETTGMLALSHELDVELVNFEKSGVYKKQYRQATYYIAKPVEDADVVINLPKLKTHSLTGVTAAIKNMFGSVPGFRKSLHHKESPFPREFARVLVDIYALTRPELTIIDGVTGIEGEGPSSRGSKREFGFFFAGTDGVAVDTVVSSFLGYQPEEIHTNQLAAADQLGAAQLSDIELAGEPLDAVRIGDLKKTNYFHYVDHVPRWLVNLVKPLIWVHPVCNADLCTLCLTCVKNCPVQAIAQKGQRLVFDYRQCINCLCCQELCPCGAISVQRSRLAEKLH